MAGVVQYKTLARYRRGVVVGIFAHRGPHHPRAGDPFTLMALATPMYLFYEASVLIGRFIQRR